MYVGCIGEVVVICTSQQELGAVEQAVEEWQAKQGGEGTAAVDDDDDDDMLVTIFSVVIWEPSLFLLTA